MRAHCPTDPTHDRFRTVAHVSEEWVVDPEGNFIETVPPEGAALEVVHGPDPDNSWQCLECGAEATVEA